MCTFSPQISDIVLEREPHMALSTCISFLSYTPKFLDVYTHYLSSLSPATLSTGICFTNTNLS